MSSGRIQGHVLSHRAAGGLRWERDSAVQWQDGRLAETTTGPDIVLDDDILLVPGFVDAHIHMPQFRVRGQFQDALLPWLRESIWPEEARFSERDYREAVATEFRDGLIASGTTAALVYGSPHEHSAHALLNDLAPLCIRGGDVLMDRNSPGDLARDTGDALASSQEHADRYGERYALTPRFVPTCTTELMEGLGRIAESHPVLIQSHVAENLDEVAWVAELHPEARSYLDVYHRAGLLGPRTVMGHGIHVDDADLALLAQTGTWMAHCPTSNVALGSGRMPIERYLAAGARVALATDVGAGPDVSMLDVMAGFLAMHADLPGLRPIVALGLATMAGARAMGEGHERGSLEEGRAADVVALRIPGGLGRGDSPDVALARVLGGFAGRWEDAVAAVVIGGVRVR